MSAQERLKNWMEQTQFTDMSMRTASTRNMKVVFVFAVVLCLYSAVLLCMALLHAETGLHEYNAAHYADPHWMSQHLAVFGLGTACSAAFAVYAYLFAYKGKGPVMSARILQVVFLFMLAALVIYSVPADKPETCLLAFASVQFVCAGLFVMNPLLAALYFVGASILFTMHLSGQGVHMPSLPVSMVFISAVTLMVNVILSSGFLRQIALTEVATRSSMRDELTGAKNRRCLREDFDDYLQRNVYLMLCDIDDFKRYNDDYSHDVGDELLRRFNAALCRHFGDSYTYRYGGDEFLVVFPSHDEDVFKTIAEECRKELSAIAYDGEIVEVSFSGGYAWGVPEESRDFREMIRIADTKLHEAKRNGKKQVMGAKFEHSDAQRQGSGAPVVGGPPAGAPPQGAGEHAGDTDHLTGLLNMRAFQGNTVRTLHMIAGNPDMPRLVMAFLDIANFKDYNHRFTFEGGNEFLVFMGKTLSEEFADAKCGRVAADKFVVLAPREGVEERFERVVKALREFNPAKPVEVNIGMREIAPGEMDNVMVVDHAKLACDSVKQRFGVSMRFYDSELKDYIEQRQYIMDNIDKAIEQKWLSVAYQPIIDVEAEEVCAYEALARWTDPERGPVAPSVFVPALEDFSLIYKLDLFMVRHVCEDYLRLRAGGIDALPVSVNLSRLDFELCDIVSEIEHVVQELGCPHDAVHLEVTESAFVLDQERIRHEVGRLRSLGFEVWMDDFGSGYSSLNVLNSFDFDLVKIDMGFIESIQQNEKSRKMLPYIVNMTKKLGIHTLSEGVETVEQLEFLKSIGCERIQGFYFSEPLLYDECAEYNRHNDIREKLSNV